MTYAPMLTSVFSVDATVGETEKNVAVDATKKIKTIYLAHPRLEKEYGLALQKKIEDLGIVVKNPFDRKEEQKYEAVEVQHAEFTETETKAIVEGDLRNIEQSDAVVAVFTNKASAGTHMEVFYASRILHRPVFCLYLVDIIRLSKTHPWYLYLTKVVRSERELLQRLEKWANE